MGITRQLARVPATQLAACRQSVEALDALCSFSSAPREDYLDLDWWPATLERAWARAGGDARGVLRHALDGGEEVNPAYRDHPGTVWEHPVTALEPAQVHEVADALRAVSPAAVRAAVPSTPDEVEVALGRTARAVAGELAGQLAHRHSILRDFYAEAARRRCAVVRWWD